jgi:hypothetical protein
MLDERNVHDGHRAERVRRASNLACLPADACAQGTSDHQIITIQQFHSCSLTEIYIRLFVNRQASLHG